MTTLLISILVPAASLAFIVSIIVLVVKQSRFLGEVGQRLERFEEFIDSMQEVISRFDSAERQVWMTERQIADLGRDVDRRCPPMPTVSGMSPEGKGDTS